MVAQCVICGKDFEVMPCYWKRGFKKTCSDECRSTNRKRVGLMNRSKEGEYIECALPLCEEKIWIQPLRKKKSKSGYFFCCKEHQIKGRYEIEDFSSGPKPKKKKTTYRKKTQSNGYRKYALRERGSKCEACGYEINVKLLDVHHIDSDPLNNKLDNLIVLCILCHGAITRRIAIIEEGEFIKTDLW